MQVSFEWERTPDLNVSKEAELKLDMAPRAYMESTLEFTVNAFQRHVPYDTGRTFEAITSTGVQKIGEFGYSGEVYIDDIEPAIGTSADPMYPTFVHEGTGLFGEYRREIFPIHGNVMAFEKLGETTVFTRWTRGQMPQPYLDDVAREVNAVVSVEKSFSLL